MGPNDAFIKMSTGTISSNDDINGHMVKYITFMGRRVPILLQNRNGPCPLLAICNGLLIRNEIKIDRKEIEYISSNDLLQLCADYILDISRATEIDPSLILNQQKIIEDVLISLPSINKGLDVNIKFNSINGFEYSVNYSVFDVVGLTLVHGWLVDPQDITTCHVIKDKSYNELMQMVVAYEEAEVKSTSIDEKDMSALSDGEVVKTFLSSTASQLTYYGLEQLHSEIKDNSICVLYRNNHFSTLFKHEGDLYILVTDIGFIDENDVVWEKLNQIDGDTDMYNGDFVVVSKNKVLSPRKVIREEDDYNIARQMQRDFDGQDERERKKKKEKDDCCIL